MTNNVIGCATGAPFPKCVLSQLYEFLVKQLPDHRTWEAHRLQNAAEGKVEDLAATAAAAAIAAGAAGAGASAGATATATKNHDGGGAPGVSEVAHDGEACGDGSVSAAGPQVSAASVAVVAQEGQVGKDADGSTAHTDTAASRVEDATADTPMDYVREKFREVLEACGDNTVDKYKGEEGGSGRALDEELRMLVALTGCGLTAGLSKWPSRACFVC